MTVYVVTIYHDHVQHAMTGVYSTVDLAITSGHEYAKDHRIGTYSIEVQETTIDGKLSEIKTVRWARNESDDD